MKHVLARDAQFGIVSVILGGLLIVASASVAGADSSNSGGAVRRYTSQALVKCMPSQITEWATGPDAQPAASGNFKLEIVFTNNGSTCYLPIAFLDVQPVIGPSNTPVGIGSLVPGVYVSGKVVLKPGATAAAYVSIASTTSKSFQRSERYHGGSCDPTPATGFGVSVPYAGWPTKYFRYYGPGGTLAVCTIRDDNVAGGYIFKTKRTVVHG
ncbi:MAG: hypothetical protein WA359_08865 [Acidimicrobiales bacterium]